MSAPVPDPARPPERTALAWQRTTLSALVCLLAAERLMAEVSGPAALVLGGLALACLVPSLLALLRRRHGHPLDGRHLLGLNLLVIVVAVAGLAYALLG